MYITPDGRFQYPADTVEFRGGLWLVWINGDDCDEFDTEDEARAEALRRFGVAVDSIA